MLCNTHKIMNKTILYYILAISKIFFGPLDGALCTLAIFILAEYITNFCVIIIRKRGLHQIGMRWFIKKIGTVCIISMATYVDKYIMESMVLRNAVILYYISNTGMVIFKNISKMGVPIPKILKETLNKIGNKDTTN